MNYYALYYGSIDGGYTDGDVEFAPPLNDYYYLGREMCLQGLSVKLTMDSRIKRIKSNFFQQLAELSLFSSK